MNSPIYENLSCLQINVFIQNMKEIRVNGCGSAFSYNMYVMQSCTGYMRTEDERTWLYIIQIDFMFMFEIVYHLATLR